ncbi:hypothetical protein CCACVL1_11310 [Corchorus capsularis]|uniref:Disease resistance protein At4g27190-like leucine-rich repeats domain-containing protein n=1 Tax=Corchorus capsularis TaxID=210143 RepID=A0A1R3IM43_COCAP|nr:hypothetical protein CCACVL1_11310 [Corchorus capsularis]
MPCDVLTSALSNAVGNLVAELLKPVIRHLSYIYYFEKNVENLSKESRTLAVAQERLQDDVERALRQTQEIEVDVQKWLVDADDMLRDVESVGIEVQEVAQRCFNWRRKYSLSKKLAKKLVAMKQLVEASKFEQENYLMMIKSEFGLEEWPKNEDFEPYTAISLMGCKLKVVPDGLVCPNLEIFILGGDHSGMTIPTSYFQGMKAIKAVTMYSISVPPINVPLFSSTLRALTFRDYGFVFPKLKRFDIAINEYCSDNHPTPRSLTIKEVSLHVFKELFWNIEYICLNKIVGCPNLVPILDQAGLTKLCSLTLISCEDMVFLIDMTEQELMNWSPVFPKLMTLKIICCPKLSYVFPISLVDVLSQLKVLHLVNLPQLKQVLSHINQPDHGNDIVLRLPSLQDLRVTNCPQFTAFIGQARIKELHLSKLGEKSIPQWRQKLLIDTEYLSVGNFEEAFQLQNGDILSSLKLLKLEDLPALRIIWNPVIITQIATLQNLTELVLIDCKRLRYIFPSAFARSLSQLTILRVEGCDELEQIIGKEDWISSSSSSSSSCFPNLTCIVIKRCHSLKCLFPSAAAPNSLQRLAYLSVEEASKLEQVFGDDDGHNSMIKSLPELKTLNLGKLPSLMRFSQVGHRFTFPCLDFLLVKDCDKATTTFLLDSKLRVHAKTEASQSFNEDMKEDYGKFKQIRCPIGNDIEWSRNSRQILRGPYCHINSADLAADAHSAASPTWFHGPKRGGANPPSAAIYY